MKMILLHVQLSRLADRSIEHSGIYTAVDFLETFEARHDKKMVPVITTAIKARE